MRFALLVAFSHLRSRQSETGVSVITLIAIAGVTVGVTAMIMVLAVMEGFELDLRVPTACQLEPRFGLCPHHGVRLHVLGRLL